MSQHEIWARAAWPAVDVIVAAGLPLERVFAGLSFDERTIRHRLRVSFDDYCIAIERAEAIAGYDAIARHIERTYYESASEVRSLASVLVSVRALVHFVFGVIDPIFFPALAFDVTDVTPDVVRVTTRFREGTRPSEALTRLSVPAARMLPTLIGLPPAEVEAQIGPTWGILDLHLPPATWGQRAARATRAMVRVFVGTGSDGQPIALDFGPTGQRVDPRLAAAARRWGLTPRQGEVLGEVAHGVSNRDIAERLAMSAHTVDAHVSELLRKAGASGRAQLIAAVWSGR